MWSSEGHRVVHGGSADPQHCRHADDRWKAAHAGRLLLPAGQVEGRSQRAAEERGTPTFSMRTSHFAICLFWLLILESDKLTLFFLPPQIFYEANTQLSLRKKQARNVKKKSKFSRSSIEFRIELRALLRVRRTIRRTIHPGPSFGQTQNPFG